ncbi:Uncharacterised protein [Mycobacteroides abscessus subsp. abscessus]|nr:Uncharacterised protein [Mycobacteroides abscessus subsp. abscessus]
MTAASTSPYAAGSTTTATLGWFLAAARTIEGPPISICSTHSSSEAPEATVAANGYRLTTTSSKPCTPSSSSWVRCSSRRVSASTPACTCGCRVFTRPSSTSGKPVTSSTGVTGIDAAAMVFAVDPVDTSSTPAAWRPLASSSSPVLS